MYLSFLNFIYDHCMIIISMLCAFSVMRHAQTLSAALEALEGVT